MRKTIIMCVAAAALAGCGGEAAAIDSTDSICTDFARFIQDGRPADQRAEVVTSIGEVIDNAHQRLRDTYDTLTNTVEGPQGAQEIADDASAQACFDAGWEG